MQPAWERLSSPLFKPLFATMLVRPEASASHDTSVLRPAVFGPRHGQSPRAARAASTDRRSAGIDRTHGAVRAPELGAGLRERGSNEFMNRDTSKTSRRWPLRGGGHLDPDTAVSPASFDVARLAAGGGMRCGRSRAGRRRQNGTVPCAAAGDSLRCPSGRWASVCSATSQLRQVWPATSTGSIA